MADLFVSDVGSSERLAAGVGDRKATPILERRPRRVAWMLLLASASTALLTGLIGTALVLSPLMDFPNLVGPAFLGQVGIAAGLTIISLMLRSLRWAFLLCRAQVRIPIRNAYIGYFAGLSLLLTPFLLGEITVRAAVHRARGGVPIATTVVINLWERFLDLVALGLMTGRWRSCLAWRTRGPWVCSPERRSRCRLQSAGCAFRLRWLWRVRPQICLTEIARLTLGD